MNFERDKPVYDYKKYRKYPLIEYNIFMSSIFLLYTNYSV